MSCGLGLIKVDGRYYNPSQIKTISQGNSRWDTQIHFANDKFDGYYNAEKKDVVNCDPEKFAKAFVDATRTGQIVDVQA